MAETNPFADPNYGLEPGAQENPFSNPDYGKDTDGPLARGWKKSKQSIAISRDLTTGDVDSATQNIAEAERYARANPGLPEGRELSQAWDRGDGISGGVKEVAGEIKKDWDESSNWVGGLRATGRNLRAMGEGVIEQGPNMVAPVTGMLAGGFAGAKVGGALGSVVPGAGTAAGAAVGGFAGGWAGASAGNAAIEGGYMAQEALQKAGIDPQDTQAVRQFLLERGDSIMGDAAVKGGIIGAVDAVTFGVAGRLLNGPARAAASRALADMGVDTANSAAVKAAMQTPQFAQRIAGDAVYQASRTGAQNVARNVGAAALDPAGEFAGEYLGQGVATGEWDAKNAALEAFSSIGQSGAMFAGQKAYQYVTRPRSAQGEQTPPEAGTAPPAGPQGFTPTAERPVIDEAALGRAGVYPPAPAPIINDRALEPAAPLPSQQMGLDPAAGPMSAAAALAVDTGASATMQQAAQAVDPETGEILEAGAKVPEQKQATDTPEQMRERLGFIEQQARVNGGWDRRTIEERDRLQAELAKVEPVAIQTPATEQSTAEGAEPAPAIDVSGRTDEQLRVLEQSGRDGWREAAVAEIQRRAAQQPAGGQPAAQKLAALQEFAKQVGSSVPLEEIAALPESEVVRLHDMLADARRLNQEVGSEWTQTAQNWIEGAVRSSIASQALGNRVEGMKERAKQFAEQSAAKRAAREARKEPAAPTPAIDLPTQATTAPEQSRPAPSPRSESAPPQAQQVEPAPEQVRRPMPSGLSFPSERIVTNVQGEFEALEVQASSIGTSDGYVNFGSQYPDGRYYIESAGKSIGFANGQWGDVTPEGLKPRGTYDPSNLQAETIRVLEGEGAKRSKSAEPAQPPADAAQPDEGATAQPDAPEFTTLKDRDGKTVTVRTADLSGARERMPMFTKDGKRKTTWIHRDNLDPTGEKQAEGAKEMADNPLFNVITTKDGGAFAIKAAASRELNARGLADTHEVVPAGDVQAGMKGYLVRKKAEAAATSSSPDQTRAEGGDEDAMQARSDKPSPSRATTKDERKPAEQQKPADTAPAWRTVKSTPFADEAGAVLGLMNAAQKSSQSEEVVKAVRALARSAEESGDATARGIATFVADNALEALASHKINAGRGSVVEKARHKKLKDGIERLRILEVERMTRGDESPASATSRATHKDPGQPAEPVTQPVIAEAIQKSARNTDFNPAEAKAWILGEIDKAIAVAPTADRIFDGVKIADKPATYAGVKTWSVDGPKDADGLTPSLNIEQAAGGGFAVVWGKSPDQAVRAPNLELAKEDAARIVKTGKFVVKGKAGSWQFDAAVLDAKEFVSFDVPGDGKFKVVNTVEKLRDFRAKVEKPPGFAKSPDRPMTYGSGMAGAVSLDAEIKRIEGLSVVDRRYQGGDVLEEIGNAIEIARLKKSKDEGKLLDRLKEASKGKDYDAWRAEQEAAEGTTAREAAASQRAGQGDPQAFAQMMAMYDQPEAAAQQPEQPASDRDQFTVERVDEDRRQTLTFKRGETVKVSGKYPMETGEIDGISNARKEFKVGGAWLPFGYAYKAEYDEFAAPRRELEEMIANAEKRIADGSGFQRDGYPIRDAREHAKRYSLEGYDDTLNDLAKRGQAVFDRSIAEERARMAAAEQTDRERREAADAADAAKYAGPVKMTMDEWKRISRDFKSFNGGKRTVMQDGRIRRVEIVKEKAEAPADAPADVVFDRAAQSATANPLRNADGTFARQDPAGDSLAFSATLPRDRNAVRIGITEKGLVRAMRLQFDGLAEITSKLLERGRAGKRGGVIVVGTADNAEIGRIVAERTGRKLDSTMRKFSSAGRLNGFYDPKTGLTFLVAPNLNPVTATAVMLHEMMHGQQRQKIDARALEMVRNRHGLKDEDLRAFLDRVMLRMIAAGEVGNAAEASAYIVEQAVIEGRSAGYTFADGAFMQWVDAKIGKRVGDFLRSFAGMIRTWMLRNGLGAKAMTVDDFVGYAMAGLDRAVAGEVRGRANAQASIGSRAPQSEAFRRWFGDSKVVDESGQPLVVYHGTTADVEGAMRSGGEAWSDGIFFTDSAQIASSVYAGGSATPNTDGVRAALGRMSDAQLEAFAERLRDRAGWGDFWLEIDEPGRRQPYADQIAEHAENTFDDYEGGTQAIDSLAAELGIAGRAPAPGSNVIPSYLSLQNPLDVDGSGVDFDPEQQAEWIAQAKAEGHDGLVIRNYSDGGFGIGNDFRSAGRHDVYVAFRPSQIKSAVGNNGDFDPDNDDIRFSRSVGDAPAQEAQRVQSAVEGKTLIEAAQFMTRSKDGAKAAVAQKVLEKLQRLEKAGVALDLKIVHRGDMAPASMVNARGYTETGFDEKGRDIVVWLNGADVTGKVGTEEEVLLHELVHAATAGMVFYGTQTPGSLAGKHARDLMAVTDAIAEHIRKRFDAADAGKATLTEFEQDMRDGANNAFRSDDEVLAWALSNSEAQAYLETIPYRSGSMWSNFVQAVRNLLGLGARNDTALSEVLRVAERILTDDAPNAGRAAFWHKRNIRMAQQQVRGSIVQTAERGTDDLQFSRSGLRELASRATSELNQTLTAPGKLSWWHKTIGTMYNLAERSPAFKPVFQSAQGFIDDVSHYAADAAERAPKLLPRLETWRDIMKSPISAEDNKAVGKPIFEGTLSWTRDAEGSPVRVDALTEAAAGMTVEEMARELVSRGAIEERTLRMWRGMPEAQFESAIRTRYENSFLQAGIVWTDDELASMFNLAPAQIALYREFRAAVDRSLDTMARADMLRFAGEDVRFLRDPVMEAETLREAASLIVMNLSEQANAQPDRAEQLMATGQGVMDRMQKVLKLQATGYAPLSRFGKYTVDVVVDGNREYFGLFETAREANKMAERMRAEFGAGTVTQGTLSDEAFRLFAGITPESLELFGNMLGLDSTGDEAQDRAFQEYLRLTKTNRSALRRLIHRKGIAGFSEDVGRVLASFAYSNARQTAAGLHMGDLSQAVSDIPKEQGELKDVAVKLSEYIKNPQEEAQAIRGLLFAQYLGGSVASAFVNMTQPAAVTFPWLSQHGGAKLAAVEIGKAAKHIATPGYRYEEGLAEALKAAEEDGVVSPQEVHQLMAQARGSGSLKAGDGTRIGSARAMASNSITRLSAAWGKLFSAAEQLNRRITFIAAYRVAKQKRMANPADFARRAVTETQFVYSKASKMQWGRGAVGGTLMTFKTYSVAYMELMSRLWSQGAPGSAERKAGRKAVALMLAMVLLMGGGGGLPFMEDAEDLIDGIAQIAGYNVSTKKARQQFLIDTFGADAADFIERGVSGLPGVPLDVSGRLGLGNLIPGTGIFLDRSNHTRDVLELLGPVGDLGNRIVTGARKALSGDLGGAALEVSPVAVRNVAKGVDMAVMDQYRDTRGRKVLETTDLEAALKAIGFQPASVAKVQDANYLNQRAKDFYSLSADRISAAWAAGIYEKDSGKVQEARDMIAQWNEDNPDQPMMIRMPNILRRVREMGKDKSQRIADTAPRAMRQQLREELLRQ